MAYDIVDDEFYCDHCGDVVPPARLKRTDAVEHYCSSGCKRAEDTGRE